jgi:AAA+ ATPase superfamily predicted ATPase
MPFVDREYELASLNERWGLPAQVALLWGRRRIGKSTLLQRFAEDKPSIFYQAVKGTETEQLIGLTDRILAHRPDPLLTAAPLANWRQATAYLVAMARQAKASGQPLLVVLDEFPYLVASDSNLPSILQAALEDVKRESLPLFLVLAGSQVGLFEKHVLQGPLYGRRTWGEQLAPLSYADAGRFFPNWSVADRLRAWAILGGIPYYLEQFEAAKSLRWNIEHRVLTKGQVLYTDAELFIAEELGADAPTYQSIVGAIAGGATRQSEIAQRAGIDASAVPAYLQLLRRLHVVEHVRPYGAPSNARSGIWNVADGYLRFWFRFVRTNLTDLEARRTSAVLAQRVLPMLDQFVSKPAFEDACREYLRHAIGNDPEMPDRAEVGAWWGQVPDEREPGTRRTRQGEIELVAYEGASLVLAGEAKWHDGPLDTDALSQLLRTVTSVPGYSSATKLALFARDGFTERVTQRAAAEGIVLRTAADLY